MPKLKELSVHHYGSGGIHGMNIRDRDFLDGFQIAGIDHAGTLAPDGNPLASLISVEIRHARGAVDKVLRLRGPKHHVIDLSGLMTSNYVGVPFPSKYVHHLHCLFGPAASGNLNAVYCPGSERSVIFEHLLNNLERSQESKITLTETTPQIHDTVMGLVQGVTHALTSLLAERNQLPEDMKNRRAKTPSATIADMIALNPRVVPLIEELLKGGLPLGDSFESLIGRMEEYLDDEARLSFSLFETPFFQMMRQRIGDFPPIASEKLRELVHTPLESLTERIERSK